MTYILHLNWHSIDLACLQRKKTPELTGTHTHSHLIIWLTDRSLKLDAYQVHFAYKFSSSFPCCSVHCVTKTSRSSSTTHAFPLSTCVSICLSLTLHTPFISTVFDLTLSHCVRDRPVSCWLPIKTVCLCYLTVLIRFIFRLNCTERWPYHVKRGLVSVKQVINVKIGNLWLLRM